MCLRVLAAFGVALFPLGCAEQLHLLDRGPTGGVSLSSFWPPPPSSVTWLAEPSGGGPPAPLSSVARELELGLRESGYSEQRWYPIGLAQSHGFAVTTRLEQLDDEPHHPPRERWSSIYADAANLRWLTHARSPTLPRPGRYRVLLLAYTDLPIGRTSNAPMWNEDTIMDWPDSAHATSSREAAVPARPSSGYRLGIYEYEYLWDEHDRRGRWVPQEAVSERGGPPPLASPLEARGFTPRSATQF